MNKYSIVGVVLTITSALIAVVSHSKENAGANLVGTLRLTTDFQMQFTCVQTFFPNFACVASFSTDTSTNIFNGTTSTDDFWSTSRNKANTTE